MTTERVVFLDGLRAAATVAVLLQHYLETVSHETFQPFLRFAPGLFGVVLFFLISGYVIPFSVRNGLRPGAFLMRRVFRIFPLFICVLTVVIVLGLGGIAPFSERLTGLDGWDYAANYLLIFEYLGTPPLLGVAWTLSVEFAWYGVFALYFLYFGHRRVVEASLLFSVGMMALALMCLALEVRAPLGRIGMIGAALLGYVFCCWHLRMVRGQAVVLAVVFFFCATMLGQWVSFGYFAHPQMSLFNALAAWLLALAVFASVAGVQQIWTLGLWAHPMLIVLGRLSFGIYLIHMPVLQLLGNVLEGAALISVATVLTVMLSELAYRFVEVPGNAFGKRVMRREQVA